MPMNSGKDYKARAVEVAQPLTAAGHRHGRSGRRHGRAAIAFDARQSDVIQYGDMTGPLDTDGTSMAVAFDMRGREGGSQFEGPHDTANIRAASGGSSKSYVLTGDANGRVDDGSLACTEDMPAGTMRGVREGQGRSPSHQRRLAGQRANQSATPMQGMSHPSASREDMLDLQREAQRSGLLQQTPSEVQEVGRSVRGEGQPEYSTWAVRRLTPTECERLQGFPDGYTAVPYRGKPASDGPRYKALGNSMAVNCMRWIGRRIAMVGA